MCTILSILGTWRTCGGVFNPFSNAESGNQAVLGGLVEDTNRQGV